MSLYQRKKGGHWYYDLRVRGVRYRGTTKQATKSKAETFEAMLRMGLEDGTNPIGSRKAPILSDFTGEFMSYVNASGRADKTKTYYTSGIRLLSETPLSRMKLDRISTPDIEVCGFPHSNSNANCALRTLRRLLKFAKSKGMLTQMPSIPLRREHGRDRMISRSEEVSLIAELRQPVRDIFIAVMDTGMRNLSEVLRMRWENVDWTAGMILNPKGKTPKSRRSVLITERLQALLLARWEDGQREGWVFKSKWKRKAHLHFSESAVGKEFRRARRELGITTDLVMYSGRHTFATLAMSGTKNAFAVRDALGHTDLRTTGRYQHPELEEIRQVIDKKNRELPAPENRTQKWTQ